MVLENYVKLVPNVEKRLRIKDGSFRIEDRLITDPITKLQKTARAAVVTVTSEDGIPVTKTFSTLSEKLASQLQALHLNGDLYKYTIAIKKHGSGFTTEYSVNLV